MKPEHLVIGGGLVAGLAYLFWPKDASAAPAAPPVPMPTPGSAAAAAQTPPGSKCRQAYDDWQRAVANHLEAVRQRDALEGVKHLPGTDLAYAQASKREDDLFPVTLAAMKRYEDCMRAAGLDPHKPPPATQGYGIGAYARPVVRYGRGRLRTWG